MGNVLNSKHIFYLFIYFDIGVKYDLRFTLRFTLPYKTLPEEIKCAKTLATFKSSLKTHLFSCAFDE